MDKKELVFKSILITEPLICDECGKTIYPRVDSAFKDQSYDIIVCLDCRNKFLKK